MFAIKDGSNLDEEAEMESQSEDADIDLEDIFGSESYWNPVASIRYPQLPAMVAHVLRDMTDGVAHLHDMYALSQLRFWHV